MNFDYSEAEEYQPEFADLGAIEFEELDESDTDDEFVLLEARVQAARHAGA